MKYYIAMDAGGSKTDSVLFDEYGHVLYCLSGPGVNPNDIGPDAAVKALCRQLERLRTAAGNEISGAFAAISGIVGYGDGLCERLRERAGIPCLTTGTDALPLLTGVLGRNNGAALIAGTGSVCFVRRGEELIRIGGWGYLIDPSSSGSGFDIGRDGLAAALHAYDGQGPRTVLTGMAERALGCPVHEAIPRIYSGGRSYVATFAGAVFSGAGAGDNVCREILRRNCEGLCSMLRAATACLPTPFTIALGGGILTHYPVYADTLRSMAPQGLTFATLDGPSVLGAAMEAIYREGNVPCDKFIVNFNEGWKTSR